MTIYEVKKGDCLSIIAKRKGVSEKELRKLNPNIPENGTIIIGQKLVLPDEKTTESAGLDSVSFDNTKKTETSNIKSELSPYEIREKKFLDTMNEFVDISSAKLSLYYNKTGKPFLKIARPKESQTNENNNYKFGRIKENLKLKKGVLEKNNGGNHGLSVTADIYDAGFGVDRDSLAIAPGHYLYIPLSEIGQNPEIKKGFFFDDYYDSPKNKAMKQAVSDFLN